MSGKHGTTPQGSGGDGRPGGTTTHAAFPASRPTTLGLFLALFGCVCLAACGLTDTDWAAPTAVHAADLPYPADVVEDPSDEPSLPPFRVTTVVEPVVVELASEQGTTELVLGEDLTREPVDPTVVVETVTSTVAGTARISGIVSPAQELDVMVTSPNGEVAPVRIGPGSNGSFSHDVAGLASGPQSVCLNDVCHRVFIAEETHEPFEVVHRRILDALVRANQIFDFESALPDWTVTVAGPSTGAGGHFDPVNKVISISGTSGRTTEEFVTTILHEVGHAMEFEHLSDTDRVAYRHMRGILSEGAWMPQDLLAHERWESPAEDFAEVFVTWLTNGDHQTRSSVADQPTSEQMQAFADMVSDWS